MFSNNRRKKLFTIPKLRGFSNGDCVEHGITAASVDDITVHPPPSCFGLVMKTCKIQGCTFFLKLESV